MNGYQNASSPTPHRPPRCPLRRATLSVRPRITDPAEEASWCWRSLPWGRPQRWQGYLLCVVAGNRRTSAWLEEYPWKFRDVGAEVLSADSDIKGARRATAHHTHSHHAEN